MTVPRSRLSSLMIGLVALGTSCLLAANPPSSPKRTQIKLLTPFGRGGLSIGMAVTEKGEGSCFAPSAASPSRPDAWRCNAGNTIHDPCYQSIPGDSKQLACPVGGPWSGDVILLTLTQPLPTEPRKNVSRDDTLPWALELVNGQRCTLLTGATAPIAGMRINYGCPGGFVVVGDIDRSRPVWRVFFQGEKSIALEQTDVAVAWF
ncbi:MAG TPA: hypothetical protein VEI01_13505 [Terriglobales bacterium]|nr:hypothetical protein [Terriglobales bacterium]